MTTAQPIGGLALGTGRFRTDALDVELDVLDTWRADRGLTASQVALAWVVNQPFAPVAVIGTRSVPHMREAIDAAAVTLTEDELTWLEHGDTKIGASRRGAAATWA